MPWTVAGAGEAAGAAGAAGAAAATRAVLESPPAGAAASEGGASALIGFDRRTWGRNRSPPLVLTMLSTKEGEKGWGEKLEKIETGN